MKNENCRVPEGETPITWEGLLTSLFTIILCGTSAFGIIAGASWFFGGLEWFPDGKYSGFEMGCDSHFSRNFNPDSKSIWGEISIKESLDCSDGNIYSVQKS